jgi:diguanylate cyclase (GGDEF)-like protein
VSFFDSLVGVAPQFVMLWRPWLGRFVAADHGLVFPSSSNLGSIAFLPLRRQGRAVGVLCFGSADAERFDRRLGSRFLEHLAAMTAICLENACNRERVLRAGLVDYLTGWHNRRQMELRLSAELARARRTGGTVACVMVDVDYFKEINDLYGHAGGDVVLREVTGRLGSLIRASDSPIRFGGDELMLLLPDTALEGAVRLAERIRDAMRLPVEIDGDRNCRVTLSMGIAAVTVEAGMSDGTRLGDGLLAAADAALYRAKAAGRDRFEVAR